MPASRWTASVDLIEPRETSREAFQLAKLLVVQTDLLDVLLHREQAQRPVDP
jgi:hypothetical protein